MSVRLTLPYPRKQRLNLRIGRVAEALNLSHHRCVFGLDFVDHAHFAGLAVRIFVHTEVLLRHFVDVVGGALFGDLDNFATNL
jgi:hypothetical protein